MIRPLVRVRTSGQHVEDCKASPVKGDLSMSKFRVHVLITLRSRHSPDFRICVKNLDPIGTLRVSISPMGYEISR